MSTATINSYYDLVVIGGGIQGAATALLARSAGYSVLLIEKGQWASGTSSKSSKLIHGGLRYLQTGQFKLVYKCLAERKWMLTKLPELVKGNWFYIPVYKNSRYFAWKIGLGLFLYRLLSGNTDYGQYKKLPKSEWQSLAGLEQENLIAVYAYQDAQTDDALLTQTVVKKAQTLGTDCFEGLECIAARRDQQDKYDVQLFDITRKQTINVACHTIVNATGPWVNETLNKLDQTSQALSIDLVQGSHLVVAPQLSSDCFYMEAPQDHRAVFSLPWKNKTLIGTTELNYRGDADTAKVTQEEVDYLIAVIKHYFPNYQFSVDSQFCGLRVLPLSDKKAFLRPRDTIIHSTDNIISLYGGKLTAWRSTAGEVLKTIDQHFDKKSIVDLDTLF